MQFANHTRRGGHLPGVNLTSQSRYKDVLYDIAQNALDSGSVPERMKNSIRRALPSPKIHLRWLAQWGTDEMVKESVDLSSCQASLNIPLVDVSISKSLHMSMSMAYMSSDVDGNGLLGNGWVLNIPQDYIVVDHHQSIFPEDYDYYMMIGSSKMDKITKSGKDAQGREKFELEKAPTVNIAYDSGKEQWIVESDKMRAVYGRAEEGGKFGDAVQLSLAWPNWRGPGRNETGLETQVNAWYLVSQEVKQGNRLKLHFGYHNEESSLPNGKSYTSVIHLKSIMDDKEESRLDINFDTKTRAEYSIQNYKNEDGNIEFPVFLQAKLFVTGYKLETSQFQQHIQFEYEVTDKVRMLTGIQQLFPGMLFSVKDSSPEPLFQFRYEKFDNKHLLVETTRGGDVTILYSYESLNVPRLDFGEAANTITLLATGNTQVSSEDGFFAVAHNVDSVENNGISISVWNSSMRKFVTNLDTKLGVLKKIDNFALITFPNLIVILEEVEGNKTLFIFKRNKDASEWSKKAKQVLLGKDAIFRHSSKIMAGGRKDRASMVIMEPDEDSPDGFNLTEVSLSNSSPSKRLLIQDSIILAYTETSLLAVNKVDSQWVVNSPLATVLSSEIQFLDDVVMDEEFSKAFLQQWNVVGLQMTRNMLLVPSLKWENGKVSTQANLFLLDDQLQVKLRQNIDVKTENILDCRQQHEADGNTFYFKYKGPEANQRYKVVLYNITGKFDEDLADIPDPKERERIKQEEIKKLNDDPDNGFNKMIMFDVEPLLKFELGMYEAKTHLNKLPMMGTGWDKTALGNITENKLGTDYILQREIIGNVTELQLFRQNPETSSKQGEALRSFQLQEKGNVVLGYPAYLAYKEDFNKQAIILPFTEDGIGAEVKLDFLEELLQTSTSETLFTIRNSSDPTAFPYDRQVLVRHINTVITSPPVFVVSRSEVKSREEVRVRTYENEFHSNRGTLIQENKVRVIPTGDKGYSGWYEETTFIPIEEPGNSTKLEIYFDAEANEVSSKEMHAKAPNNDEDEEPCCTKILDVTGELEIANIAPFNTTDQMVSYFGFESYETPILAGETMSSWTYPEESVVKNGFSLTGTNLLQLSGTQKLEGTFTPKDQSATFIGSCWVRSKMEYEFEAPVPFLQAKIRTQNGDELLTLHGQMKRQTRDWLYLEVTADLEKIRNTAYRKYLESLQNTLSKSSRKYFLDNVTFNIHIQLDASRHPNGRMDVDHVRFLPIQYGLDVSVFHAETGLVTSTILPAGGIIEKLYNRYFAQVGDVDESGRVEQLVSGSKSGHLFPTPVVSPVTILDTDSGVKSELIFQPESSSYEIFDTYSFLQQRWKLASEGDSTFWEFSKSRVAHLGEASHRMSANSGIVFDPSSSAVRFVFSLNSINSSFSITLNGHGSQPLAQMKLGETGTASLSGDLLQSFIAKLTPSGEIIVFVEDSRLWLWIDGALLIDQKIAGNMTTPWSQFHLDLGGDVELSQVVVLNQPQVTVEYFNIWGDRTQAIQLETEDTILVTERIYDEIGREAIKAKTTRILRPSNQADIPLLHYQSDFATNKNPQDPNSVFKSGKLEGLVEQLNPQDEGFSYTRTVFEVDLLYEPKIQGLPGKEFSVIGTFSRHHSRDSDLPFMRNLFPPKNGFRQKVLHEPNGNTKVSIFDTKNNEVAKYVKVKGHNHILTTYQHDDKGRLVKILPPNYHSKINTFGRTTPWPVDDSEWTGEELQLQAKLGSHYNYNGQGQLARKATPDTGTNEYVYDTFGNMRFMYSLDTASGTAQDIVYFVNGGPAQPVEIGYLQSPMLVEELKNYENSTVIPGQSIYQRIVYSDTHTDPELRGRAKLFMTYCEDTSKVNCNGDTQAHQEMVRFNAENKVILRTTNNVGNSSITNLHKSYQAGRMKELMYPKDDTDSLSLIHSYDKVGRVIAVGTRQKPGQFATYTHSAVGQVQSERINPGTEFVFNRTFEYNSPGLLTRISDPHLEQNLRFTRTGYGQMGTGEGIIMENVFRSSWSRIESLDEGQRSWFRVPVEDYEGDRAMATCVAALQRLNFLDKETSIPLRFLTQGDLSKFPIGCTADIGYKLMKLVAEKMPPSSNYGHKYAYGNHQELIMAKHLDGEESVEPLQVDSFLKEIPEVGSYEKSEQIWDLLVDSNYVILDSTNREDKGAGIGKQGSKSFFRYGQLQKDLQTVAESTVPFAPYIMALQLDRILSKGEKVTRQEFQNLYVEWYGYIDYPTPALIINREKTTGGKIHDMLEEKGYISGDTLAILEPSFVDLMKDHRAVIGQIVGVLRNHFQYQIGLSVHDFQSYSIDPNGNHKMFYAGLERHELEFKNDTNQISKLIVRDPYALPGQEKIHSVEHDSQGNIIKAEHRGIEEVQYHPVTKRPTSMKLKDGKTLVFKYDAQGERILKRVFGADNVLTHEVEYVRDEEGKVLMDKRTSFSTNGDKKTTTSYLHGPRGLIGFIRGGKFYSVFTDHSGSVRLVMQDGRVVAGYDYLPYGDTLRAYGYEGAQIMYRFTGQEYDVETGLYNYHARIYDPSIGRFFQPDPKAQYFSPYVYAGNSPISLIDPDGEFAFLIAFAIAFAIGGAYLGAAAVNKSWNPAKWDLTSWKTWKGLLFGGLSGAFLPGSLVYVFTAPLLAAAAIMVGLGMSYFSMAGANGSWNPAKWKWSSPETWNAFLSGFASGVSAVKGISNIPGIVNQLTKTGQKIAVYVGLSGTALGGSFIFGMMAKDENKFKFWKWDFSDPETIAGILNGFTSGISIPVSTVEFIKGEKFQNIFGKLGVWNKNFFQQILKNPKDPLFNTVGNGLLTRLMSNGQSSLRPEAINIKQLDWNSASTFEGVINEALQSGDISAMLFDFRTGNNIKDESLPGNLFTQQYFTEFLAIFNKQVSQLATLLVFHAVEDTHKGPSDFPSIAMNLFINAVGQTFDEFETRNAHHPALKFPFRGAPEISNLLSGLYGGSKVFLAESLEFLECVTETQRSDETWQTNVCDIGEESKEIEKKLLRQLFYSSENHSKARAELVHVPISRAIPEKFEDHFVLLLENVLNQFSTLALGTDEIYYFIESLFNSMRGNDEILVRQEEIKGLNERVLHIAVLSGNPERITVKSIIASDAWQLPGLNVTSVVEYIAQQSFFLCDLKHKFAESGGQVNSELYILPISQSQTMSCPLKTVDLFAMMTADISSTCDSAEETEVFQSEAEEDIHPTIQFRNATKAATRNAEGKVGRDATSGATKSSFSFFPLNVMKMWSSTFESGLSSLFGFFRGTSQPDSSYGSSNETFNEEVFNEKSKSSRNKDPRPKKKQSFDDSLNCQIGAWRDGEYIMDGVTCLTEKSKITVFRSPERNDILGENTAWPHVEIDRDNFSKSSCGPVEFNGVPSVTCKGKKTTFVYMPFVQERMFDNIDANIMFASVAAHLGGKLWRGMVGGQTVQQEQTIPGNVTKQMLENWEGKVSTITTLLESYRTNLPDKDGINWASVLLNECKAYLKEIKANTINVTLEQVEDIQERLKALYEDIMEQMEFDLGHQFQVKPQSSGARKTSYPRDATYFGSVRVQNQQTFPASVYTGTSHLKVE